MFRAPLVLGISALLLFTACGENQPDVVGAVTGARRVSAQQVTMPSQVLGLQVAPEDISKQVSDAKRPYIESVGLFSLREGDLVRATFQVSHFNPLARPDDPDFRSSIISLLGASRPEIVRVEDMTVYVTTGTDQNIFIWFRGRGFYVLTTHQQYEFPRTLLRRFVQLGEL